MDPVVDSRLNPGDAGIPVLRTESEGQGSLNTTHHLSNVMFDSGT